MSCTEPALCNRFTEAGGPTTPLCWLARILDWPSKRERVSVTRLAANVQMQPIVPLSMEPEPAFSFRHRRLDWIFWFEKNPNIQHFLDLEFYLKSIWRGLGFSSMRFYQKSNPDWGICNCHKWKDLEQKCSYLCQRVCMRSKFSRTVLWTMFWSIEQ